MIAPIFYNYYMYKHECRAVQRSEFLGGPSLTDLQNTGGARLGASIDFLKNWGGRGPPGPPGSYGPELDSHENLFYHVYCACLVVN